MLGNPIAAISLPRPVDDSGIVLAPVQLWARFMVWYARQPNLEHAYPIRVFLDQEQALSEEDIEHALRHAADTVRQCRNRIHWFRWSRGIFNLGAAAGSIPVMKLLSVSFTTPLAILALIVLGVGFVNKEIAEHLIDAEVRRRNEAEGTIKDMYARRRALEQSHDPR